MSWGLRICLGLVIATFLVGSMALAQSASPTADEAAIQKLLQTQVDAWNRHDLEAFMAGYWNSLELTFFSGANVAHGWQAALDRYRKNYQSGGREMGKLEFQDLQIEKLGPDSAFVRGKFLLTMSDGKHPHGLFTLVLKRFTEGWRIIHDHSSGE